MLRFLGGNCTHHQRWRHPGRVSLEAIVKLRLPIPDDGRSMRSRYSSGGNRRGLGFRSYTVIKFLCSRRLWCLRAVSAELPLMPEASVRYPVVSMCYRLIVMR